ncbi:MAG: hypothetical protein EXR33_03045 [Betaproteobacteria bacterium]|nr:hypothetical protein [Betaproteobacteria bacterium]
MNPLGALSPSRLRELADITVLERAARGSDPLAAHKGTGHSVFLLRGELFLMYEGGGTLVVVGGMGDGRHPLNRGGARRFPLVLQRQRRGLDPGRTDFEPGPFLLLFSFRTLLSHFLSLPQSSSSRL